MNRGGDGFIRFLIDTPVVAFLLLLAVLLIVVPAATLLFRKKPAQHIQGGSPVAGAPARQRADETRIPEETLPTTRFLGTQMDLAMLLFGLLLLLALVGWVKQAFFD